MYKFLFFILFFYLTIPKVSAQKIFSEDFSTNLNQWELVNGNWNYWQVKDQALYATITQSRKLSTIVPKNEFWQSIEEYTVDFIFKVFDSTDKNFVVGMRDANNFYDFHFYNNQLIVEDIRNGNSLHSVQVPFILELNKNYAIHLLYVKGKIELFIDGQKIFQTDQFWSPPVYGGKFGLKIATGSLAYSRAYFDQIVISELDSADIIFKQNDDQWANETYDHAASWSTAPTMSRWACALSSAAMLLRTYAYYFLPSGEEINPLSLNQWLLSQEDGYIADGLVNWLAISRLSKVLSEQSNHLLPKLEFSYFDGTGEENLDFLKEQLLTSSGQIATDGKHFFLIKEHLSELHDFVIKDPLYDQELLSQKTEPLRSLRVFTPSQTDLSYLLFVLPKEFSLILSDDQQNVLKPINVIEQIENNEEKIGEDYQIIYYSKPTDGKFNLLIQSGDFSKLLIDKVQIFTYQNNGNFTQINLSNLISEQQNLANIKQLVLQINYFKNSEATFNLNLEEKTLDEQKQMKLDELVVWSKESFESGNLSFYLFYQLNLLIDSLRDHLDYFFLLEKFLQFHQL